MPALLMIGKQAFISYPLHYKDPDEDSSGRRKAFHPSAGWSFT